MSREVEDNSREECMSQREALHVNTRFVQRQRIN